MKRMKNTVEICRVNCNPKFINCLDYRIYNGDLNDLNFNEKTVVNTLNQYSYCIAKRDIEFQKSLYASDILLPDGIGITTAARMLNGIKIKKIAGADLHHFLLGKLNREKGSCFYLGSTYDTLTRIRKRIATEYPHIQVETYSPPYKPFFSIEDNQEIFEKVNSFQPDVLFVGMTAPKQEKWSFQQKNFLHTKMICSIGAVFDFYAETKKRPSNIWIEFGLEWLGRLIREPKRMWKRYIYYGFVFGYYLSKEKYKKLFAGKNRLG